MKPAKYKPQLFIDTKDGIKDVDNTLAENIFAEIDKYSITPTTFKARTLSLNNNLIIDIIDKYLKNINLKQKKINIELSNIDTSLKNLYSTNIISNDELKGYLAQIQKPIVDPLQTKLQALQKYETSLIKYQNFVKENNDTVILYQDTYVFKDNGIIRYGINTSEKLKEICVSIEEKDIEKKESKSKASSKSAKDEQDVQLHPLEVLLIKDAIYHLCNKDTSNAVLVDIFAREDDGNIKLQGFKLETHTIVLYKNNKTEFAVIDPSNSDFSKHLASNINKMFINTALDVAVNVIAPSKQIKIYEPADKNKIGTQPDQYRDCIDIAVKIAFGLGKLKGSLNINYIASIDIIKQVSNNDDISDSIPDNIFNEKHFIKIPLRIQQKSNLKIVEDFYNFSKTIKENITNLIKKNELQNIYTQKLIDSDTNLNIDTL